MYKSVLKARKVTFTRNISKYVSKSIEEILKNETNLLNEKISVSAWIKSARQQKANTFLDLDDGSGKRLQVVLQTDDVQSDLSHLKYHSAVKIDGILRKSTHPAQNVELESDSVRILTPVTDANYPLVPRKILSNEFLRQFPHFR